MLLASLEVAVALPGRRALFASAILQPPAAAIDAVPELKAQAVEPQSPRPQKRTNR